MFEISWSELLILAIVTLVFIGPKDLPAFMRTLGRYAGVVRRQAAEFRTQFDAAMREAELDSMRKEVESLQASVNAEVMRGKNMLNPDAAPGVSSAGSSAAALPASPGPAGSAPAAAAAATAVTQPPMPAPPRAET